MWQQVFRGNTFAHPNLNPTAPWDLLYAAVEILVDEDGKCPPEWWLTIHDLGIDEAPSLWWRLPSPPNLIAAYRATQIVAVNGLEFGQNDGILQAAYFAGVLNPSPEQAAWAKMVLDQIGAHNYQLLMASEVPNEVITAILEHQCDEDAPDINVLTEEIRAGTVAWTDQLDEAGVIHPNVLVEMIIDAKDAKREADEALLATYAPLVESLVLPLGFDAESPVTAMLRRALLEIVQKTPGEAMDLQVAMAWTIAAPAATCAAVDFFAAQGKPTMSDEEKVEAMHVAHEDALADAAIWLYQSRRDEMLAKDSDWLLHLTTWISAPILRWKVRNMIRKEVLDYLS